MGFMQRKKLKKMVSNDELALGLVVTIPNPKVAEIASTFGCDFIRLDAEHILYDLETIGNFVRAADSVDIPVIVRLPDTTFITPLLDFGVAGVMMPHIQSAQQAEKIVELVKYYPVGRRGMFGFGRAQRYGEMEMSDYIKESLEDTVLIAQIEDEKGIANMDEIVSVEGIDLFCTGRADISQSLGIPGETTNPRVLEIENRILEAAAKTGHGFQLSAGNLTEAKDFINRGVRAITIGVDVLFLSSGIKEFANQMQEFKKERSI